MHCDRAQEFFSDYLERTLDRPMTMALEAHLTSCVICREELEALQDTLLALDAVPDVVPPADGAWDVMRRLRNARAEQLEAERRKAPTFLEWLRSLNPLSVGMGASLATLVIGGTLLLTTPDYQGWRLLPLAQPRTAPVADVPALQVTYGEVTETGQQVNIQFTPVVDLPGAKVRLIGASLPLTWGADGSLSRGRPVALPPVELPRTSSAEAVRLTVESPALGKQYQYLLVVPLGERRTGPVTLFTGVVPLEEGLRRLAPYLNRPMVVEGPLDGNVDLRYGEQPAEQCLEALAEQVNAVVDRNGTAYRITSGIR